MLFVTNETQPSAVCHSAQIQRRGPGSRPSPTEPGTPLPSRPRTACLPERRDGTGRDGTGLSLRLAPLLCVPHASLCPALPSPALLSSPPLPWRSLRGALLPLCRLRAAAPGSSRDGAQPCGQRRSRRCLCSPLIIFEALLFTLSTSSLSFVYWGLQACAQYSR